MDERDKAAAVAQWAWVAGVLEACGSFSWDHGVIKVAVIRPDEQTAKRLKLFTNCGTVFGPRLRHGHKPQWLWAVTAPPEADRLLSFIKPWLSKRRQQQLERLQEK